MAVTLFGHSPCTVTLVKSLPVNMINAAHMPTPLTVLGEQLRMSYRQLPAALGLGLILAVICTWLLHDKVPALAAAGWLIMHFLATFIRFTSLRFIASSQFRDEDASVYSRRYLITAIILGSVWGAVAFSMPYLSIELRVFVYVLLISIAGGALSSNAGHFASYLGYVAPMLAILAIQSFLLGTKEWSYLGLLTILYLAFIVSAAKKLNNSLHESISHRFSWQLLADELEETRGDLNQQLSERLTAEKRLKKVMTELEQAVRHLRYLSTTDELTGLANRRSFDTALAREWNRARRNKGSIALLMIDVDRFKDYNDIYHHQSGDKALEEVALVIGAFAKRPGDIAARYGGEEFALILSNPSKAHLQEVAEDLRTRVIDLEIEHRGSDISDYLTVSIGAALIESPGHDDYSPLISAADSALYRAKQEGRNRSCFA